MIAFALWLLHLLLCMAFTVAIVLAAMLVLLPLVCVCWLIFEVTHSLKDEE